MRVRKAVIPAAGLGTRFLPATKAMPKEMIPLVDKPVIQYVVQEAVDAGITDILIVTGLSKRSIEDHFDRSPELEARLAHVGKTAELQQVKDITNLANFYYVRQKEPLGLGDAVRCAEQHIGNEPFAVLLADDLMVSPKPAIGQLMDINEKTGASVIGVEELTPEKIVTKGVVAGKEMEKGLLHLTDMVEKPPLDKAPSNLGASGRYVFTPAIFSHLKAVRPDSKGEYQLTDAIRTLIKKEPVYAKRMDGMRYDSGNKMDFLKATIDFALARPEFAQELRAYMKARLEKK